MKYRDPNTGEFKEISVKASDTLPVGTIVDYDGTEIPSGWEEIEEEKLVKNSIDSTSIASKDSWTNIKSYTVTKSGTAIINYYLKFLQNASNDRGIGIILNNTELVSQITLSAKDNSTRLTISCICNVKKDDIITARALQTSDSSLNVNGTLDIIYL